MDNTVRLMLESVKERADEAYGNYRFFRSIGEKESSETWFTEWSIAEDIFEELEKIAGLTA